MKVFRDLDANIKIWLNDARKIIINSFSSNLNIETKSGPTDLVTNIDKEIEKYYTENIKKKYPQAKILGEETYKIKPLSDLQGLVFVIDPIDGTMNFVKQKRNFMSMIAVYYNGSPVLGYIYDIVQDELYWGGPQVNAVYCNKKQLKFPHNSMLNEGLVQLCRPFVVNNEYNAVEIVNNSAGLRMYGCAGLGIINVLTGRCNCYFSRLKPWDYLAGKILAETLDLSVKMIDEKETNMLSSKVVLVTTKNTKNDIMKLIENNKQHTVV